MKRIFNHPPASTAGKKYWRSIEEFADTPEFRAKLEREFPQGAAELEGDEISRRGFMKFMGASVALAGIGLTGCRRPELHLVPYSKGVEWQVPGNALHYATSMPRRGGAIPLIATTYNGRPTKLEGNADAPGFNGATDVFGQSAILDLYDPDRSKAVLNANERGKDYGEGSSDDFWKDFAKLRSDYMANGGEGLAVLAEPCTSPTRERLRLEVQKQFPKLLWAEYEPWAGDPSISYDFSKADVILSLDADFLGASEGTVQSIAGFAAGRRRLGKTQETMSRLYVAEGRFSLTGGMADHRLRLPSSAIGGIAIRFFGKLCGTGGALALNSFAAFSDPNVETWITEVANDLSKARGRSLVVCGSQQPPEVHEMVAQINKALGNEGVTVFSHFVPHVNAMGIGDLAEQISQGAVKTLFVLGGNPAFNAPADLGFDGLLGQVDQVIRLGLHVDETSATSTTHLPAAHFLESWGDSLAYDSTAYLCQQPLILPLYGGISELDLLGALAGLPKATGPEYVQETFGQLLNFAIPVTLQTGQANIQTVLATVKSSAFQNAWHKFVHDGWTLAKSFPIPGGMQGMLNMQSTMGPQKGLEQAAGRPLQPGEYELNFVLGCVDDGRYANNGWLQELPDPVSKLTWDNALYMSPKTADALAIKIVSAKNNLLDLPNTDARPTTADGKVYQGIAIDPMTAFPMVKVTTPDGRSMELPVLIAPGQADATLTIALGWGRTGPRITEATQEKNEVTPPLRVADGAGFNAYQLRTSTTPGFVVGVKVEKIDKTYPLAITQEHNSMEGRGLVREAPLEKYHADPAFVQEIGIDKEVAQGERTGYQNYESGYDHPPLNSPTNNPDRPAWGMSIDLNTCVGCNACVVACQAENNIPIVGKFQVLRGREMHWIRTDRYFASDNPPQPSVTDGSLPDSSYLDDPQMLIQPMACQQCENAPCEPVCPVNATVHNEEGLNVMAYNRCIGTRYCANNCPYKVRRFNFFNYNDRPIENVKLPVLGLTNELYLGPFAGRDGPLTYKGSPESLMLQKNPNVTVRIRGVMEKCTYCVQRIEEAKIGQLRRSNNGGEGSGDVALPTDSFKVACQQACPAEAIVFGNLNDPASKVTVAKQDERNYGVLAYLDTRPRTTYLGRVRNPNPAMPGAQYIGHTSVFEETK
ncbi:MAG TPA: TAT-variant-translocated molybdopterin oxidoreductase [Candidatus Methylacidiphilales bacterium]|jgi:molybdopterin-containing oxidoreductase family iron-sulfur binding subunit|nr:TAT-variant-translocated molybdopterin oxidoreductase [Candidatus Methylacidiphilales bacterium]